MDENSIYSLNSSHLKIAAEILAKSFMDDPLWSKFVSKPDLRYKNMSQFFHIFMRYNLKYGECYGIGEPLKGVAIWYRGKHIHVSIWGIVKAGIIKILNSSLMKGFFKHRQYLSISDRMHDKWAPKGHYYLCLLAISPDAQGKGCASKLLYLIFQKSDNERIPIYLETTNPNNVPIYEHYGFEVKEIYQNSKDKIPVWGMLRLPKEIGKDEE